MPGLGMTLLAQQRRAAGQHRRVIGPVRRMAQGAVLGYGLMFEGEGTAFFRVALVAGLVQGRPAE